MKAKAQKAGNGNGHAPAGKPASEPGMQIVYRRLDTIKALPGNAKKHALSDIATSIASAGFIDPLAVNLTTGNNMDGNGRLEALKMLYAEGGPPPKNIRAVQEEVDGQVVTVWYAPTIDLQFDAKTEPIVALALNRLNEKGGYDPEAVLAILEQAQAFGRLEETGYDEGSFQMLLALHAKNDPANVEFKEYNESVESEVKYHTCPNCSHKWPA